MDYEIIVRFDCPECGKDVLMPVQFEPVWYGENTATPEIQTIIIECPHCGENLKARAWAAPSMCSVEFIDYPETLISANELLVRDVDDDWDDYDVPADPYSIFNASIAEARYLLDEKGGDGRSLVNRMVFAYYIGAFEAFLADTLINEVLPNEAALKRLIEGDEWLRHQRFSLAQIAGSPNLIKDTVRGRLRAEVWHRIKNASALYDTSFGIDIRAMLGKKKTMIDEAIHFRHDCVHRNGRDKDGNELTVFTKEYVIGIGVVLSQLAHGIVKAFNEQNATSFFGGSSPERF
jgi:predicted RNA-binding Zn-ribbon protein involved in translation (DUF1610 family)